LQLSPSATAGPNAPEITPNGVVSATAFKSSSATAPGSWLEIFGTNLSVTTRGWAVGDFAGNVAPTSLDGVSVTIGDKSAYVAYVSPTQLNVLVPDGVAIGAGVPVVVKTPAGESQATPVNTTDLAPELLAPSSFAVAGRQYAVATLPGSDGTTTFVGPSGAIAGVNIRPAKPGEVLTLYGIGFGQVSPAIPAGFIASTASSVTNPVTVQFGSTPATVQYAGVAPGFVGLYQFNVQVPNLPAGDWPLLISVNGTPVAQNLYITAGQ
jgi:uncharacterized protein (TIGR03437 family)